MKDELGISLDKADESVLGVAAKVSVSKEHITIVGDGSTQAEVEARVKQVRRMGRGGAVLGRVFGVQAGGT